MSHRPLDWKRLGLAFGALASTWCLGTARAEDPLPGLNWNRSAALDAPYGRCFDGRSGSATGIKVTLLAALQESTEHVIAMQELHCLPFNGGAGLQKVSCDSVEAGGVPYAYCLRTHNDGMGNDVAMGVMLRDSITDALGLYTGCPRDQQPQSKLALVQSAGVDPRRVSGLVTLACGPADTGKPRAAGAVPCPAEPNPYARCVGTGNDGHGNSVIVGIVAAHGPGDPNGLYGECNSNAGILPGFLYKSDVLRLAGVTPSNVHTVDILNCAVPWGIGGWFPHDFSKWDCATVPGMLPMVAARYRYCVLGTDAYGDGVILGVAE